jgi:AcrR family transcriptional regulator
MLGGGMASRRTAQKEATREHLYAHALRLFDSHGYDAVGIDDIVREADVARGTFYFHFPKKDDVLIELIARSDRHIVGRMNEARRRNLKAVLRATTGAFAEIWESRRALLPHAGAVALRRIAEVEEERERQPLRLALGEHVELAVANKEIRPKLPPQMLADVFLLDVFAALMAWARTGEPALELVMNGVIDLFLTGATG